MSNIPSDKRVFMFLQGPHGPFFNLLAKMLTYAGAEIWRVGFNAGDRVFWSRQDRYCAYRETVSDWPDAFAKLVRFTGAMVRRILRYTHMM